MLLFRALIKYPLQHGEPVLDTQLAHHYLVIAMGTHGLDELRETGDIADCGRYARAFEVGPQPHMIGASQFYHPVEMVQQDIEAGIAPPQPVGPEKTVGEIEPDHAPGSANRFDLPIGQIAR